MNDLSRDLIYNVKLVEKYKNAIPLLKRMLKCENCNYFAGTLLLNIKDPVTNTAYTAIDIMAITNVESLIIQEAQYLASSIYVKHKARTSAFYEIAEENIKIYNRELL